MPKSDFRKHVDQYQSLPPDVMLGQIVWLTINDGAYSLTEIEAAFEKLGLNPTFVPLATSSFNAFEKACTKAQSASKPYPLDKEQIGEIMAIREVVKDDERVVRQVIREVRDSRANKLRHEPVAELVLYRQQAGADGKIDRSSPPRLRSTTFKDRLLPGEMEHVEDVITRWEQEFDRLYNFVDGDKVRAIVRNYLGFLNAVMMKSGVYFVFKNREDELELLRTFVDGLPGANELESIPIPELKRLRESVIEAFQDEAEKELQEVVTAINKVRSTRQTITPQALAKLTEQYQRVMRKANEYGRTLRCTQDRTAGAAEIALESLNALRSDMQRQMEED